MPLEDLTKRADFSDYDESVVKDMPKYPGLTLTSHVLLKNIQVGNREHACCAIRARENRRPQFSASSRSRLLTA